MMSEVAFTSLELRNVIHFLSVLKETTLGTTSLVEKRFSEQATEFEATLSFLLESGGIIEDEGRLRVSPFLADELEELDKKLISVHLFERILIKKNIYRTELFGYLSQFKQVDGEIEHRPNAFERTKFSSLRNFLMEAGVVGYDRESDRYVVAAEHINLYAQATVADSSSSPDELRQRLHKTGEVGEAAEKAVLDYEKRRVGSDLKKHVEHISIKNTSAGYDIKSVTQTRDNVIEPRYIEVKAVSPVTYKFYWTSNEMRVAEILRKNYYLYLLPVAGRMKFALPDLKIVCDPLAEIILTSDPWKIETNMVCCSLR